jgi:hypothetical protein
MSDKPMVDTSWELKWRRTLRGSYLLEQRYCVVGETSNGYPYYTTSSTNKTSRARSTTDQHRLTQPI